MAKLTCEQIAAIKQKLREKDKEARKLIERGLQSDPEGRKLIIEIKQGQNDLRNRLREANKPTSKTMRWMNVSRGLVTSRMYTAANNTWQNAILVANEVGKVPTRVAAEAFGASKEGAAMSGIIERIADLGRARNPETRQLIDDMLKLNDQYDRGFMTWASDVGKQLSDSKTGVHDWTLKRAEKITHTLGAMNRLSDNLFFRPAFLSRLREIARREGLDLGMVMKQGDLAKVKSEWVKEATDHAMDMTMKREINETVPRIAGLLQWVNKTPAALLAVPFPRFMGNAIRFMWDHSPVGLVDELVFTKGVRDSRKIAAGVNGTIMLGVAYQVKKEFGGDNWYELRLPGTKETLDIRRWNPALAPYMIVVDTLERMGKIGNGEAYGRPAPDRVRDVLEILSGANLRGGVGADIVSSLTEMMKSGEVMEPGTELTEKVVADFLGRFVAPFTQIRDFYAAFDPKTRVRRDTRKDPVARLRSGVFSRDLPEHESATRAEPPKQSLLADVARFGGQRINEASNRIEKELDKMGVARSGFGSVAARSGVPKWDRMVNRHLGEIVEAEMDEFLDGDYAQIEDNVRAEGINKGKELRKRINLEKRDALRKWFNEKRAEARDLAKEEEGGIELWEKAKLRGGGYEAVERRNLALPEEERVDPDEE